MNKKEVIKLIGKENWKEFNKFMQGQTVGIYSDGSTDYYKWDVERFKYHLDNYPGFYKRLK
jgi:hypothetical protein